MEKENETSNSRDFVTTSEAAEALGVSYYTVYEYIKEKRLVAEMVGGIYMIPKKAVQEFKAKPTGRVRTHPPHWRKYRAGAKVRGMDIRVGVRTGQQKRLIEKLEAILEAQRYLFPGTMQRYIFEEESEPNTSSFRSSGKIQRCQMSLSYNKTSNPYRQNWLMCLTGTPRNILPNRQSFIPDFSVGVIDMPSCACYTT